MLVSTIHLLLLLLELKEDEQYFILFKHGLTLFGSVIHQWKFLSISSFAPFLKWEAKESSFKLPSQDHDSHYFVFYCFYSLLKSLWQHQLHKQGTPSYFSGQINKLMHKKKVIQSTEPRSPLHTLHNWLHQNNLWSITPAVTILQKCACNST